MRRVLIIGAGGAGKTTLATRIGELTGLPVIHLDALYWRPGWVEPPKDEWLRLVDELVARGGWVMDGNYSGTLDVRLGACDTVIFLDMPRWLGVWRVFKRWLRYRGDSRPDMAPGCPEQLPWEFVRWIWTYADRRRPRLLEQLRIVAAEKRVEILRSPRDVERFVASLGALRATADAVPPRP